MLCAWRLKAVDTGDSAATEDKMNTQTILDTMTDNLKNTQEAIDNMSGFLNGTPFILCDGKSGRVIHREGERPLLKQPRTDLCGVIHFGATDAANVAKRWNVESPSHTVAPVRAIEYLRGVADELAKTIESIRALA